MQSNLIIFLVVIACSLALNADHLAQHQLEAIPKNTYPIRFGYVSRITEWFPVQKLAAGMGVPGYTDQKIYNYISLGQWKCGDFPANAASVWSSPVDYFGSDTVFGQTNGQIRANLRRIYNAAKVQVLITAFGSGELPASYGFNAVDCAQRLGSFVLSNNLDGCEINWQDTSAFQSGIGEQWLINFQSHLRQILPNHTIVHSPSARHFHEDLYPNKGYTAVNAKVGSGINFYNVKYFNQSTSKYDNCQDLFNVASGPFSGTAVSELIAKGIDKKKIVIAKPVSPMDTDGSGWMDLTKLGQCVSSAYSDLNWFAGIAIWQYSSDVRGKAMTTAAGHLKELCALNKDCK